MTETSIAVLIFLVAYGLIIWERYPREIIALGGALLIILFDIVSQDQAIKHIDFNTLGLLLGMMVIVSVLKDTGIFQFLALFLFKLSRGNGMFLFLSLSFITALASAFLDNVTTVLLMVPVSLSLCQLAGLDPKPVLIGQILAANIGGTATLIGDPPNIMIGSSNPQLSFADFLANLAPVVIIIYFVTFTILTLVSYNRLKAKRSFRGLNVLEPAKGLKSKPLLRKSLLVLGITFLGFFLHNRLDITTATVALTGALLLLLLSGKKPEKVFKDIEWPTIFFFIGLFVLVGSLVEVGLIKEIAEGVISITDGRLEIATFVILWTAALVSAFVDNIPFVAAMIPVIQSMEQMVVSSAGFEVLWWALALGACLGGNGTLIGASANIIVAGIAKRNGIKLRFITFFLIAFPLMLISIIISTFYLQIKFFG